MAAAASRKEEERNERIVRGLLKLPPNRRCINCNGLGPQYVCTSFWTFICISCSGIHREFTHRVKSVSMSKFTMQEVEALQKGGNQRAREAFLKDFDTQQMRLPDSSNIDSLREFIRAVYVERRYAGVLCSERPPRDKQNQKAHEEECARASSYHSFSQSPPYDYQYEERRNGKKPAMLSRKPGSDRGHDGKMSGFAYRSHSLHERMSEDQFTNESCGSRTSDCSGSSMSDTLKTTPESPNFLDDGCLSPPIQQNQSSIQNFNGITQSQRTAPAGEINSSPLKSGNSSLADLFFYSENVHGTQQSNNYVAPSFATFTGAVNGANEDLFSQPVLEQQPVAGLKPFVDFFANTPSSTPSAHKVPLVAPLMDNAGWATFDTPLEDKRPGVTGQSGVGTIGDDKQILSGDLFSFELNDKPTLFQTSKGDASVTNQSVATSIDTSSSQFWHSFDDASRTMNNDPPSAQPVINEQKNVVNASHTTSNPFTCSVASEECHDDGSNKLFMDGLAPDAPLAALVEPSHISDVHLLEGASADQVSPNPFDLPFDDDSEAPDLFMDVSMLQGTLRSPNLPTSFLDGLPETWFSNSTSAYVPSGSHGGLPCLVELVPNCSLRMLGLCQKSSVAPTDVILGFSELKYYTKYEAREGILRRLGFPFPWLFEEGTLLGRSLADDDEKTGGCDGLVVSQ